MTQRTCNIAGCEKPSAARDLTCGMHRSRIHRHGSPDGKATRKTLLERVEAKVLRADGDACWEWSGSLNHHGYGVAWKSGSWAFAHRVMYEGHVGPIPDGMVIDHICHNPKCARPDHLRAVTNKQNVENFGRAVNKNNTSGYRGVQFHKRTGRWIATAVHNGRKHLAGYHDTPELAAEAARDLRIRLHTHNDLDHSGSCEPSR